MEANFTIMVTFYVILSQIPGASDEVVGGLWVVVQEDLPHDRRAGRPSDSLDPREMLLIFKIEYREIPQIFVRSPTGSKSSLLKFTRGTTIL